MRIAVMTLTRDRLPYTQHCFQTLRDNAGCSYDHFVLDQGSTDGTVEWLDEQDDLDVTFVRKNIGICPALNLLLDEAINAEHYDVLVRVDNDAEVLQPDTLQIAADLASRFQTILAPRVLGLRNPPPTMSTFNLDGYTINETTHLGGIFMAIPATLFSELGYRFNEQFPPWTGDEDICRWYEGRCGYIDALEINHYLTTDGQAADDVEYLERKLSEMSA